MKNRKNKNMRQSRREFIRRMSMGLGAAAMLPVLPLGCTAGIPPEMEKYYRSWDPRPELPDNEKLGIALVGLGSYATGQLGPALLETKFCKLSGIVTGTPEKEGRWAEEYGIPESNIYNYENYDSIADNRDIDIIYIVLPNGMHAEYTIRAAEAGKHVICEKPMATTVEDSRAMLDACRAADRKLSLGYRLHFEPHNEEAMRLGQHEILGPIEHMDANFGFNITRTPDVWRLNKEMAGGGPLMDVGLYLVQAGNYVYGASPIAVTAQEETNNLEVFDEVEETISFQLEYPNGAVMEAITSYSTGGNHLHVQTRDGNFSVQPAYGYGGIGGEVNGEEMDYPGVNQQTLQMDAFTDHILNDAENRVPGEMGVLDMEIMMAIYEAADTGRRIPLNL